MKKQGGFTLIELVVVIVILGILAVTAAPRFLNLQDDARNASLEGLKGAMAGATGIVYGRAAVDGVESEQDSAISGSGGVTIETVYGYPEASANGIGKAVVGLDTDWSKVSASDTNIIKYTFKDQGTKNTSDCHVKYTMDNTSSSATPTIEVVKCS